jgi:hypothetical protein
VDFSEALLAFVVVDVAHHLKTFAFTLQVIKDQAFACGSDVGDSARQRDSLFEELVVLAQGVKLGDEVGNGDGDVELVRVRVSFGGFFHFLDHVGSIFIVLSGVENDFFFFFLLFFGLLFGFLFGLFFGLFGGESFLFIESFLFVFAEFAFTFGDCFTLLVLGSSGFDFLEGFLLSCLLRLVGVFFHLV